MEISVVLPVYNEEESLVELHEELDRELRKLGRTYQIVFVNDGSSDSSVEILLGICADYPDTVTFIDLRRNFGQTAATSAGIDHARGRVIVFMDADLQNDPSDIKKLLDIMHEGQWDVVSGWRTDRKDTFISRTLPSRIANSIISTVTGVHLHDYGCTLKAYRREVLDEVKLYGEMHRFIPVFAAAAGARITETPVKHRPRVYGRSKYGLERTFKVIVDLITVKFLLDYRTRPMYIFGGMGTFFILGGFLTIGLAILRTFARDSSLINTPLPVLAATLFAIGMQSILMGLLAELIVRTYYESQEKPVYVVRRVVEGHKSVEKPTWSKA
ncbi:MAG: glycosyltransferase family 2 protein [Chloroflexi bacterium]|nr:glycosyltransferase family 2 protein [Chloroflexota bacterium]